MFMIPQTGIPQFDRAMEEAFNKVDSGQTLEGVRITISALSDLAVEPGHEEAKRAAIADLRALLGVAQ